LAAANTAKSCSISGQRFGFETPVCRLTSAAQLQRRTAGRDRTGDGLASTVCFGWLRFNRLGGERLYDVRLLLRWGATAWARYGGLADVTGRCNRSSFPVSTATWSDNRLISACWAASTCCVD